MPPPPVESLCMRRSRLLCRVLPHRCLPGPAPEQLSGSQSRWNMDARAITPLPPRVSHLPGGDPALRPATRLRASCGGPAPKPPIPRRLSRKPPEGIGPTYRHPFVQNNRVTPYPPRSCTVQKPGTQAPATTTPRPRLSNNQKKPRRLRQRALDGSRTPALVGLQPPPSLPSLPTSAPATQTGPSTETPIAGSGRCPARHRNRLPMPCFAAKTPANGNPDMLRQALTGSSAGSPGG